MTEHNIKRTEAFVFVCDVCARVCKSKAGLVNHRRRMHEESASKKTFKCEKCMNEFKKESEFQKSTEDLWRSGSVGCGEG